MPTWAVEDEDEIDGVELRSRSNPNRYALAHRATYDAGARGRWQVTDFDERGPISDVKRSKLVDALTENASPYEYEVVAVHTRAGRQPGRGGVLAGRYRRRRERIPGGLAPGGACPPDTDPRDLRRGIKVEHEHTNDRAVAREIACDHLTEDPRYYTKLRAAER